MLGESSIGSDSSSGAGFPSFRQRAPDTSASRSAPLMMRASAVDDGFLSTEAVSAVTQCDEP